MVEPIKIKRLFCLPKSNDSWSHVTFFLCPSHSFFLSKICFLSILDSISLRDCLSLNLLVSFPWRSLFFYFAYYFIPIWTQLLLCLSVRPFVRLSIPPFLLQTTINPDFFSYNFFRFKLLFVSPKYSVHFFSIQLLSFVFYETRAILLPFLFFLCFFSPSNVCRFSFKSC